MVHGSKADRSEQLHARADAQIGFAIGPLDDRRVMFMDMIERAREIVDRAAEVIDDHRPWSS